MLAEWTGLEPATPGVTGRYSNQLNYHSIISTAWTYGLLQRAISPALLLLLKPRLLTISGSINTWRPHGDSNPGTYRERVVS